MNQSTSLPKILTELLPADANEGQPTSGFLVRHVSHPAELLAPFDPAKLPRALLAHILTLLLLRDLLMRVPVGWNYIKEKISQGKSMVFDHGALRTVHWHNQALPCGYLAFARLLEPLGFKLAGEYPLPALHMSGFVYTHCDYPEQIAQFFVSELYPDHFSPAFQHAVDRTLASTRDPLSAQHLELLNKVATDQYLTITEALVLIPALARCFDRQHKPPSLQDYQTLAAESAEMAWIATEGNAFNHATDRVDDLTALDKEQRRLQRPLKSSIETGQQGRIKQTAYRATVVERSFTTNEGLCQQRVPGSFFEFIERSQREDGHLELRFDSRNAQGIFKMTR